MIESRREAFPRNLNNWLKVSAEQLAESWAKLSDWVDRQAALSRERAAKTAAARAAREAFIGSRVAWRAGDQTYIATICLLMVLALTGRHLIMVALPNLTQSDSYPELIARSLLVLLPVIVPVVVLSLAGALHPLVAVVLFVLPALHWLRGFLGITLPPEAEQPVGFGLFLGVPAILHLSYCQTADRYSAQPAFAFVANLAHRHPRWPGDSAHLSELRQEWVRYRRGISPFGTYIDEVLATRTYQAPLPWRPWRQRALWNHFFSHLFHPELVPVAERLFFEGGPLEPDMLRRSEPLFVWFLEANRSAFESRLEHERQALAEHIVVPVGDEESTRVLPPPVTTVTVVDIAPPAEPSRQDFIAILAKGDIGGIAEDLVQAEINGFLEVRNRPLAFWRRCLNMPPRTLSPAEQVQAILNQLKVTVDSATEVVKSQAGFSREWRTAAIDAKTSALDSEVTEARKKADVAEEQARQAAARQREAESLRAKRKADGAGIDRVDQRTEEKSDAVHQKELAEAARDKARADAEIANLLNPPKPPTPPTDQERFEAEQQRRSEKMSRVEKLKSTEETMLKDIETRYGAGSDLYKRVRASFESDVCTMMMEE